MINPPSAQSPPPPPAARVDIYTRRFSAECMRAKALLDGKGAFYNEFITDSDEESLEVMRRRTGGKQDVPQIFINGRSVDGLASLEALEAAGELDILLGETPRDLVMEEARAAEAARKAKTANAGPAPNTIRDLLRRFIRR